MIYTLQKRSRNLHTRLLTWVLKSALIIIYFGVESKTESGVGVFRELRLSGRGKDDSQGGVRSNVARLCAPQKWESFEMSLGK